MTTAFPPVADRTSPGRREPDLFDLEQLDEIGVVRGNPVYIVRGQPDPEYEYEYDRSDFGIPDKSTLLRLEDWPAAYLRTYIEGEPHPLTGVKESNVLVWAPLRRHPAGWAANRGRNPAPLQAKRSKALRAIDALGALGPLSWRPPMINTFGPQREEKIVPIEPGTEVIAGGRARPLGSTYDPGRHPIIGAEPIIRALRRAGVELELSADRAYVIPRSEKGRLDPGWRQVLDRGAPLLVAHLRGEPLRCVAAHDDEPPVAVTLAEGGAPLCERHVH